MAARWLFFTSCLLSATASAVDTPRSYVEAEAAWKLARDRADYQRYGSEFVQFNNHFHLDVKDGCYDLSYKPVSLMLVITHSDGGEYALIERALTDTDTAKARCFRKTYEGLQTKVPPYVPFIFQMQMN